MREPFSLGARLLACAELVRSGSAFADIGTDHGYLPVWLMKTGRVSSALAADIGEGPLSSAKHTAEKYHADIKTVLSDGFSELSQEEVDDAVIAGMGGELIAKIISEASWLKDPSKQLILQPMSTPDKLRKFLFANGFDIIIEKAIMDEGKIYSVMLVVFDAGFKKHDRIEEYMGKIVPGSEFSREYAEKVLRILKNKLRGFEHQNDEAAIENMNELIDSIKSVYLQ